MNRDQILADLSIDNSSGFDQLELLKSYPEPVIRYFRHHLPNGIPGGDLISTRLRGIIKLVNWSYFKSTLYSHPLKGFLWEATVRMGILPIKGFDYFDKNIGAMQWKLFGVIPVTKADGADVSRSAEGRARLESIFAPHLLIDPGIKWEALDEHHITAQWSIHTEDQPIHLIIDDQGALREIWMKRWGNPGEVKTFGYHTFGGHIDKEILYHGRLIPHKGSVGWWYGEKAWDDGEFFRFEAY
ncbi:MAG: hypothetical protein EOM83_01070 [Clostridia bacterium]|nr:hypothetical protein [Clostridia bacterium]